MRCLGLTGNNERSAGSEKTAASLAYGPGHHRAPSQPRSRRRKRPTDRGVSHGAQVQPSERGDVPHRRQGTQRASHCYRVGAGLGRDQDRSSGSPTSPRSPSGRLMASRDGLGAVWQAGHQLRAVERDKPGPKVNSQPAKQLSGFLSLIESHDLKKDSAYRWMAMSFAPREAAPTHRATANAFQQTLDKSSYLAN